LIGSSREKVHDEVDNTDTYSVVATSLTSAHVWKAWVRVARYWAAIAAEVEQAVDPIVGGEEALSLAG
jgi:hypothetical protein